MGKQALAGAALASHLAKERKEELPLKGAALRSAIIRALVGSGKDGPMMIGDQVVEQFPEVAEVDERVPWDGEVEADGNFVPVSSFNRNAFALVASNADFDIEERRVLIQLQRIERREARAERKQRGWLKLRERTQRARFVEAQAKAKLEEAVAAHAISKHELNKLLLEVETKKGAAPKGAHPASPAATGMSQHIPPNRILRGQAEIAAMFREARVAL